MIIHKYFQIYNRWYLKLTKQATASFFIRVLSLAALLYFVFLLWHRAKWNIKKYSSYNEGKKKQKKIQNGIIFNIVRFSISIVLGTKPILHAQVEIHFNAKWRTAQFPDK